MIRRPENTRRSHKRAMSPLLKSESLVYIYNADMYSTSSRPEDSSKAIVSQSSHTFHKGILNPPPLHKLHKSSPVLDAPHLVSLDFHPGSLQILVTLANASKPRIRIKAVLLKPNLRFSVRIKLLALENVQVDRESPSDEEEGQWDNHSLLGTDAISNVAENSGTGTKLAKF